MSGTVLQISVRELEPRRRTFGWVGWWVVEKEAVRMSYCTSYMGGWVGWVGWLGGKARPCRGLYYRSL